MQPLRGACGCRAHTGGKRGPGSTGDKRYAGSITACRGRQHRRPVVICSVVPVIRALRFGWAIDAVAEDGESCGRVERTHWPTRYLWAASTYKQLIMLPGSRPGASLRSARKARSQGAPFVSNLPGSPRNHIPPTDGSAANPDGHRAGSVTSAGYLEQDRIGFRAQAIERSLFHLHLVAAGPYAHQVEATV